MAHPVPQNVTAFEFHLVGNMTLRQFGYLAAGLIIAYLLYITLGTPLPFIAIPLALISAGIGAAFAFLPIMERPLDYWLKAFLKAISKPTQRTYQSKRFAVDDPQYAKRMELFIDYLKNPANYTQPPAPALTPTDSTLVNLPAIEEPQIAGQAQPAMEQPAPTQALPIQQSEPTATVTPVQPQSIPQPQPAPTTPAIAPQPAEIYMPNPNGTPEGSELSKDELNETVKLAKEAQQVQSQILFTERKLDDIKMRAALPGAHSKDFTEEFQAILQELQNLNQKARKISKDMVSLTKNETQLPLPPKAATRVMPKPNIIPTLNLTQHENIINGIVTDSQGSYLEGAIIVTHDDQGLPVRALKSNKLGQFIAATPLENGIYTINIEKDNFVFDTIQVELKGLVLNPIVISAKPVVVS